LGAGIAAVIGQSRAWLEQLHSLPSPSGRSTFTMRAAPNYLICTWPIPLLWVIALFNSRGNGPGHFAPLRKLKSYAIG